jgi:transmembrane sensor
MSRENSRDVRRAAGEWLAQRDAGRWADADEVHFQAWLNASTMHRVEFLRLQAAWNETRRMKALAAGIQTDRPPPAGQWNLSPFFEDKRFSSTAETHSERRGQTMPISSAPSNTRRARAVAAGVLLCVGASALAWNVWPAGHRYTTSIGGTASISIPDGSRVTLNTNSQIRVALTSAERHVDLQQGEAFFEVAKDSKRPFVVEAGRRRVVAVGTRFSVRRERDVVQVVVTEGKVRLEDASKPLLSVASATAASAVSEGPDVPLVLPSGTVARAGNAGVLVQHETVPEAEAALSWRSGMLTFRDTSLADAIAEFNRYNERQVVIEDPAVAALKIGGNFRSNNVADFLELLQGGYPVRVVEETDRYVLGAK